MTTRNCIDCQAPFEALPSSRRHYCKTCRQKRQQTNLGLVKPIDDGPPPHIVELLLQQMDTRRNDARVAEARTGAAMTTWLDEAERLAKELKPQGWRSAGYKWHGRSDWLVCFRAVDCFAVAECVREALEKADNGELETKETR